MKNQKWYSRTELLLGSKNSDKLRNSHILVVGLGGVGAYAAEVLCRAGVGKMTIVDADNIDITNINRQLPALHSNIGIPKANILAKKFIDINPEISINPICEFIKDKKIVNLLKSDVFDYIIDAIDSLSPKTHLILNAKQLNIKIVSSMGAGGKLDPSQIRIADISKTYNCGLARALRKNLKKFNIYKGLDTVFSPEERKGIVEQERTDSVSNTVVGTISYIPAIFGCFCASVVIRNLIEYAG